ncbi:unnamed protein product [Dovyalis caffra]|uniref:PRA1 family protein n=1 Tax=Dovyalis caffra TaxID=77055 RepID=A0AAV1RDU9_9ROSI|nr:unnamed protein product [Dovyalis caffra]
MASPFDTHNWVMLAFFVALLIYATASVAEVMLRARGSIYYLIVGYIRLFASGFATILLLVILDPILGCIFSILWVCLYARLTYGSYKELSELLRHTAQLGLDWRTTLLGNFRQHRNENPNQANQPPPSEANPPAFACVRLNHLGRGLWSKPVGIFRYRKGEETNQANLLPSPV